MRVMVLGAGGFIGRHIVAELLAQGHDVVGVVRRIDDIAEALPTVAFVAMDLAQALDPDIWSAQIEGVDIVVNAAGLLRGRDLDAVHVVMPRALHIAAQHSGVSRIVLISAISARPDVETDYSTSKLAGEEALKSSGLPWTILRPSLVYGDGSYGGTSLMRGMAGLPLLVPIPGDGRFTFTPIHVRDLARAVRLVCEEPQFAGQTLEPVGPDTLTLRELLTRYRGWLGFGKAHFFPVPMPLMWLMAKIGDWVGDGPIATNSLAQMIAGNAGDSENFARVIGFQPRSLNAMLVARPAQVQDRWHARLFFMAPALTAILAVMWLASAWLGLFHGEAQADALVRNLGLPANAADPLRVGSSLMDIAIAALVIFDRRGRWSTIVQLVVVMGYSIVITIAMPHLWLDPFGPLLKNVPILLAIAVHGAIGDKR
jgi:uncharacterized protein YbjT (DUF2867 family)